MQMQLSEVKGNGAFPYGEWLSVKINERFQNCRKINVDHLLGLTKFRQIDISTSSSRGRINSGFPILLV
jgi:hypothetical protein